ncbi:alpha/beta hydrolase [Paenibacillus xylanilyticus]|uniref:alpha/beta hydrolase n=1 Tax=Paenibacillus xylanilyticus TaxID=248903 RepID=UPI00129D6733|nr:alpha/beta hydrolase-fold protein [Paenibacillus xylanilyticus]
MKQVINQDGTSQRRSLPGTSVYKVRAERSGREYVINAFVADIAPPPNGYPVIYLLDANAVFGTMVEAMRVQSVRSDKTGVVPAVIVGIGYEAEQPFPAERYYDFMMQVPEADLPRRPDGASWPEYGGAEEFMHFIEKQLKPEVEEKYSIDRSRQSIVGHSLGGLLVLQMLLANPGTFRHYIAGSPSIHWNSAWVEQQRASWVSRAKHCGTEMHVLITAGEQEGSHPSGVVGRSRELAHWLGQTGIEGFSAEFTCFEDEGHISVLPILMSRAIRFASRG